MSKDSPFSTYKIKQMPINLYKEWLLEKHYAKRLCPIAYAFGMVDISDNIEGVSLSAVLPTKNTMMANVSSTKRRSEHWNSTDWF